MTDLPRNTIRFPSLRGAPLAAQWAALLLLSTPVVLALEAIHLPAALLLGPMAAAILVAAAEGTARIPEGAFVLAQGFIGAMAARAIRPSFIGEMAHQWPLFLAGVLSVIVASYALGWVLARNKVLPGTIAIWGSSPGAATAMVVMAEAFGADVRLVAFMQYLRVVLVAIVASAVARLWHRRLRRPASRDRLVPAARLGALRRDARAGVRLRRRGASPAPARRRLPCAVHRRRSLPSVWRADDRIAALAAGDRLRRGRMDASVFASRAQRSATPRTRCRAVAGSILLLIAICGGLAALLSVLAHVDPLTAYLAMSPGGADIAAIIAASSNVDMPFVMAMQTTRFVVILLTGPAIARFVARRLAARGTGGAG